MQPKRAYIPILAIAVVVIVGLGYAWLSYRQPSTQRPQASTDLHGVTLTDVQARQVSVIEVGTHTFDTWRQAVGYVDYDQGRIAQVSSPYAGRVASVAAKEGDTVHKGQLLFTIDSPDLLQAESTLLAADGVLTLSRKALERTQKMLPIQASAKKDVEQAVSDEQTAEANYRAARNSLLLFGKSEADIDRLLTMRKVEGELRILSPFDGIVANRSLATGDLVQPGSTPTPFTVANLSNVWVVANAPEDDASSLKLHQSLAITVPALPGRTLHGEVSYIASAVDPNTHTVVIRADVPNPGGELLPQMLADIAVQTAAPEHSLAVPEDGIVREGDGTTMVYVTRDGRRFDQREVKIGKRQQGMDQILQGLQAGERVAGEGALFLDNMLVQQPDDD
ncbi:efflux RND transporter periplasmic adaptor subunit [Dyella mobilis]|uniref:Efflux RND transporter periplasmic adaptor subunit n=1 Tax=Dyella mobilis TaxID=1849582 RepID=A0ABS2KGF5_9GAMM|nr:efflux RND transporter periplasmic adaptor subunit [Dyella mobilis]MBM7129458.1 efflux RND transporter periplasmic adaptor subunit [Dyella mobilis]GLQ98278.1 hemolysin secretion protein D [Dyella mobilis]